VFCVFLRRFAAFYGVLRTERPCGCLRRSTILCVPDDRLLTPAEAAKAIGVGRATLAKWARQGKVTPTQVLPNGDRRWDLADLRRQLDELARRGREED